MLNCDKFTFSPRARVLVYYIYKASAFSLTSHEEMLDLKRILW